MDDESPEVIMAKLAIDKNEQIHKFKQEFKSLGSDTSRKIASVIMVFCMGLLLHVSTYFELSEEVFYACMGGLMFSALVFSFAVHESEKINKRMDLLVKIIDNDFHKNE